METNNNFDKYNYEENLKKLETYLENKDNVLTEGFLLKYIFTLIEMGYFEKANYYIDLTNEKFPEFFQNKKLINLYIQCHNLDKAHEMIIKENFSDKDYFILAKQFFRVGYYEEAEHYFNIIEDNTLMNKSIYYLNKIMNYKENNKHIRINYNHFKYNHNLKPGHIVYVRKVDDWKYQAKDKKSAVRPYLIWDIVDDQIYAFPVSTRIKINPKTGQYYNYILYTQKYQNFSSDRAVKQNVVTFKEKNIEEVTELVDQDDFENILRRNYALSCTCTKTEQKEVESFRKFYKRRMHISPNDIIITYSKEDRHKNDYFVLKVDNENQCYEVIELIKSDNDYEILNPNPKKLKFKSNIMYNIKLTDQEIFNIREKYNNCEKEPQSGDIILFENSKYLILNTDEENYMCIDRIGNQTINFSFDLKIINKKSDIQKIDTISKYELDAERRKFKEYRKKDYSNYQKRKSKFYSNL